MGKWVITVAGIAILSVLCDVILPDGQTRKYIKTVVGVVVTLVMLQPIVNFVGNVNSSATSIPQQYEVTVQQSYLDMVANKQIASQVYLSKSMLQANGIEVKDVTVSQSTNTVKVSVNESKTDAKQTQIIKVIQTYFSDYKITIEWK